MASDASPPPYAYARELRVAQLAVQRAALLTRRVFGDAVEAVAKDDRTPVTVGDFGAQALIVAALRHGFPGDAVVAEEEAARLRRDPALRDRIWRLVRDTRLPDEAADRHLLGGPVADVDAMLDLIDGGRAPGGPRGRVWTIDPIDGTKGFLRGGQYAVCLALVVDGDVKVGVLGCPNLPVDDAARLTPDAAASHPAAAARGVLFSAVRGHGATSRPLAGPSDAAAAAAAAARPIAVRPLRDLADATFCESFEPAHSAHDHHAAIARRLAISRPSVRMDSQAKYGSLARGAGDIYLRLPVSAAYREKIWDHAAGDLIVREAGGRVSDVHGKPLDFGAGRTLANNTGVVAAPAAVHDVVLRAVQAVLDINQ